MREPRGTHATASSGKQGKTNTHRVALICYSTQKAPRNTREHLWWEDARLNFKWDKRLYRGTFEGITLNFEFFLLKIGLLRICQIGCLIEISGSGVLDKEEQE